MSHQHQSGDNPQQASKERQEQICEELFKLEIPASIAYMQRLYERELENAQHGRNELARVLTDNLIRFAPNLDNGVLDHEGLKEYLSPKGNSVEQISDSADAILARVRLAVLSSAKEAIDKTLPQPQEQQYLQEILTRRDSEVRGFLGSQLGGRFKKLVGEWWHLEGEKNAPSEAVYRRLVRHFSDYQPNDSRDIRDQLQKELAPSD